MVICGANMSRYSATGLLPKLDTFWLLLGVIGAGLALEFSFNYLLTSNLSISDYGDYKILEAIGRLGGLAIILGGGQGALYFLPHWRDQNRPDLVSAYIRFYLSIALYIALISLVVLAGYKLFISYWNISAGNYGSLSIFLILLAIPIAGYSFLNAKVLQVYGKASTGLFLQWIIMTLSIILFLLLLKLIHGHITIIDVLLSVLFGQCLKLGIQNAYLYRLGITPHRNFRIGLNRQACLSYSVPIMFSGMMHQLLIHTDIFMLEILGKESNVGLMGVCSLITSFLLVIKVPVSSVMAHRMNMAYKAGTHETRNLSAYANRLLLTFCIPVALIITFFSSEILTFFGEDYAAAETALRILMAGYILHTLLMLPTSWLRYTGQKNQVITILAATTIMNIVLTAALIPVWQLNGAAIATSISLVSSAAISCALTWRHLRIPPFLLKAPD